MGTTSRTQKLIVTDIRNKGETGCDGIGESYVARNADGLWELRVVSPAASRKTGILGQQGSERCTI